MDNQDQNINNQLPQSPVADGNQPSNPTQPIAVQVIKPILPTVDNEASGAQPMPITSDSIYPEGQVDLDISPDPQVDPSSKSPSLQQAGDEILKEQKKDRSSEAIANGLAGEYSPGLQYDLHYQNSFLHNIGMSWWTWILIECVIGGIIYLLKLPDFVYSIVILPVVIVLAIKRA